MTALIIILTYAAVGLGSAFFAGRYLLRSDFLLTYGDPEPFDYGATALLGILAGALWPITLTVGAFALLLRRDAEKNDPKVRMAILDERERRIADLERELGIK